MKNIFFVGNNKLIEEYYYVGKAKLDGYVIYANKSGHHPVRVRVKDMKI